MNIPLSEPIEDKRMFFRTEGTVYLRIDPEDIDPLATKELSTSADLLDPISLQIFNLKNKITYNKPEDTNYLLETVELLSQVHQNALSNNPLPFLSRKHVIISGSGLEFMSESPLTTGQKAHLTLAFVEYPFQTLKTLIEIQECTLFNLEDGIKNYKIATAYLNISEYDRDQIVKFVNHLQRKHLSHQKTGH